MGERVGVIGLGLIGGSIATALQRLHARVTGYDIDEAHTSAAQECGLIHDAADRLEAAVRDADLIVLAVPVLSIIELLPVIDASCSPEAVILDTGSVKEPVVKAMSALPGAHRAVGGHPLAGSDRSGPGSADAGLFRGHPFVICPSSWSDEISIERVERLARALGAEPRRMEADEHDRVLARTSHLPQLMSTSLALSMEPGDLDLAGTGLREMTRLAGSDPIMWRDIAMANRKNVALALRTAIGRMEELARLVEMGDGTGVERMIHAGNRVAAAREVVQP